MRCPVLIISPWFWSKSFTLSIGAAADLATMAAATSIIKFVEKILKKTRRRRIPKKRKERKQKLRIE